MSNNNDGILSCIIVGINHHLPQDWYPTCTAIEEGLWNIHSIAWWSPVGCMCAPCVKKRSPVKAFREPLGNSLVLFQALRALFPSWDVASEQALRSWVLSIPSTIRTRLDGLSLEELHELSGWSSSPPPPATSSVYTQTVRLFMPRAPARALLISFDTTAPQPSVFATAQPSVMLLSWHHCQS